MVLSDPRARVAASRRARLYAALACIVSSVFAACSSGGGGNAGRSVTLAADPTTGPETTLTGFVMQVRKVGARTDTTKVVRAQVWTVPASDEVFSDSVGMWTINAGLSQRQYRIWAKFEDLEGHTSPIPARVNKMVDGIVVVLGADETTWPPDTLLYQKAVVRGNTGPGKTRCCD